MPDNNSNSPRRRPVDVLFGEEVELKPKPTAAQDKAPIAQAPGYMVEAPRPITSVRPPPPEFPTEWQMTMPPEVISAPAAPIESPAVTDTITLPPPVMIEPPAVEPIPEAVTFTVLERAELPIEPSPLVIAEAAPNTLPPPPPAYVPPAPAAPVALYGQTELVELSQFVDQLYQNVADETSDSAALNAECLAKLHAARAAIEKGEYAQAETYAEQVKARLLRARTSRAASAQRNTRLVFAWLVAALLLGVILLMIPFVFRIVPAVIPLLRGVGMGMLGGAIAALWQLTRQISARAFEPGMLSKFALSPLLGAGIGIVLYPLSILGIMAAPGALGIPGEPWLMYLFALVGGLFNDRLLDAVLNWRKTRT